MFLGIVNRGSVQGEVEEPQGHLHEGEKEGEGQEQERGRSLSTKAMEIHGHYGVPRPVHRV